jgi:hypothetical protein
MKFLRRFTAGYPSICTFKARTVPLAKKAEFAVRVISCSDQPHDH